MKESVRKITKKFEISGPFNIQFLVKDADVKVVETIYLFTCWSLVAFINVNLEGRVGIAQEF